jgi:hypothetical protein
VTAPVSPVAPHPVPPGTGPSLARRLAGPFATAGLTAAVVGYVGLVDPNQAGHYPTCPFLFLTGFYCPGCGSLRAIHALAHLDVLTAVDRNPLTVAAVPLLVWTWLRWTRRAARGRARTWAAPTWAVWSLLAVILGFWLLRNLPGLEWLAP